MLPSTRRALAHRVAAGQADGRTPSLVGAVVRDGIQAWCGARSMLEGHDPDDDTQYRIGSLTKTFIALLVMRLRDEGRLDLADPLGKHLDAAQAASATIAQLLSHTAGLASETPGPWWERSPGDLRPALADILGPARHPAGRLFHYSNPGDGDDRVLATKTLAEMRTPASPPGDDAWTSGYGLGLQLFRHDGRVFYGHSGSMPGFLATLCISPDLGSFVFTRKPYEAEAPLAAQPDPEGWRAF